MVQMTINSRILNSGHTKFILFRFWWLGCWWPYINGHLFWTVSIWILNSWIMFDKKLDFCCNSESDDTNKLEILSIIFSSTFKLMWEMLVVRILIVGRGWPIVDSMDHDSPLLIVNSYRSAVDYQYEWWSNDGSRLSRVTSPNLNCADVDGLLLTAWILMVSSIGNQLLTVYS